MSSENRKNNMKTRTQISHCFITFDCFSHLSVIVVFKTSWHVFCIHICTVTREIRAQQLSKMTVKEVKTS